MPLWRAPGDLEEAGRQKACWALRSPVSAHETFKPVLWVCCKYKVRPVQKKNALLLINPRKRTLYLQQMFAPQPVCSMDESRSDNRRLTYTYVGSTLKVDNTRARREGGSLHGGLHAASHTFWCFSMRVKTWSARNHRHRLSVIVNNPSEGFKRKIIHLFFGTPAIITPLAFNSLTLSCNYSVFHSVYIGLLL